MLHRLRVAIDHGTNTVAHRFGDDAIFHDCRFEFEKQVDRPIQFFLHRTEFDLHQHADLPIQFTILIFDGQLIHFIGGEQPAKVGNVGFLQPARIGNAAKLRAERILLVAKCGIFFGIQFKDFDDFVCVKFRKSDSFCAQYAVVAV